MINKIKKIIMTTSGSLVLLSAVLVPGASAASASTSTCTDTARGLTTGANATGTTGIDSSCGGSGTLTTGAQNLAKTITTDFSILVGAISVIMIIYAGFKYITSGGSNENTNSARNILMYAVIGLVIAAIAQLIVHLVINSASKISGY